MGDDTVFVSYRRQLSWPLAQLVYRDLTSHGFNTFLDSTDIGSGEFDRLILRQIELRRHFVVLLQTGSLDRIHEEGDWLRREIAHALACDRNIVPVTADGFELRHNLELPDDVARLPYFNGVSIPQGYFEAAMEVLRTRLKMASASLTLATPRSHSITDLARRTLASTKKATTASAGSQKYLMSSCVAPDRGTLP